MSRAAWPALLAGAVLLSGCASSVGGLPVQWRADGPPVVTAPPGDCPALDGAYDSTGQAQGDETKTATLQPVLGRELGLTRLLAVNAEPAATVTIARAAGDDAWLLSDAHGEVRLAADGAPPPLTRTGRPMAPASPVARADACGSVSAPSAPSMRP